MDLKQLHYFTTVVQEGTISQAARKLNLSQPPLSLQIKQLETELHCILLKRGSRKVELTEAGSLLYERALSLLNLADMTKKELTDFQRGEGGSLRLGVISSVGATLLPSWISGFRNSHPQISYSLVEANTYQLLDQLHSNLIDLAIIRTPFQKEGFCCIPLIEESILAVGHCTFLAGTSGTITLKQLSNLPLIYYRRWEKVLEDAFLSHNLPHQCFCKNDDAKTTALWADSGYGVGIIPASAASLLHHPDSTTRIITSPPLTSSIALVYRENTYQTEIMRSFIQYFQSSISTTGTQPD